MIDLLLIFLVAAYLENLVLAIYFDRDGGRPEPTPYALLASAGLVLLLAALGQLFAPAVPAPARLFVFALAFMSNAIATVLCIGDRPAWRGQDNAQRLRKMLPVLVANVAVLAFALLDHRRPHGMGETLATCLAATVALAMAMLAFGAMRHRLLAADLPAWWRGTPIHLLTAALMSLAAMGFLRMLP